MNQSDLCFTSATELAALVRRGDLSPVQLVAAVLDRIERYDADLNAFCVVLAEQARNAAAMAERKVAQGAPLGPLHGVPVSIKDVTAVQGVALAMGSRALSGDVAAEDAVVVSRLREAGAIVIGKTTTPEFGCKAVTDSQLDGVTRNPWRRTHIAGGSSGGAAVAVASGMGPLAEGTDGAGSVRIPASCCGVVGMKPSLGRVPIYPRNGFETTSHEGPIARTVADAALMLDVISGPDHRDMFSLPASDTRFAHAVPGADVRGWRIAYAHSLDGNPVLAVVSELTDRAVARFVDCDADVVQDAPVIPDPRAAMGRMCDVVFGSWAHDHARPRLDSEEDMDPHLLTMMRRGNRLSAFAYYRDAVELRSQLFIAIQRFFEDYDLLVTPTLGTPPFVQPGGPAGPTELDGIAIDPFLGWTQTYLCNLTGHPAISLPCGFTADGLPVGLQLIGRRHADAAVLQAAAAFEAAAPWSHIRPPQPPDAEGSS